MTTAPSCPRCLGLLHPPDAWASTWRCDVHGDVPPYRVAMSTPADVLTMLREQSGVPVWAPRPLPVGWFGSGVAWAGDEREGAHAAAIAATGPSPVGGPADLVLIAEEPGVGLGARLAGLDDPDPGLTRLTRPPEARLEAAGRPTPLWTVAAPADRAAFVGEARGVWLWVVLWPADAGLLLLEGLLLADLRETGGLNDSFDFGAPSPYLT